MQINDITIDLTLNKQSIVYLINALDYYLTCPPCLNNYSNLEHYFEGEEPTLKVLYDFCMSINNHDLYAEILQRVTTFYYETESRSTD